MSETPRDWFPRWQAARKAHFSSAEKLWEQLRADGYKTARSTVLGWEGSGKRSAPGPDYRPVLAAMNGEFAELIRELEEREREADGLTLAGLADSLARLEETVELLAQTVEASSSRLDELERRRTRTAARRAREGSGR